MNSKVFHLILGILVPPLGVFLTYGISSTLVINILLTFFAWIPGSIHGVWAIAKHYEKLEKDENSERAY